MPRSGAFGAFVLVRDDGKCRIVLRIDRHDTVAKGDFVVAALRPVEEVQCLLGGVADLLGIGDLDLL